MTDGRADMPLGDGGTVLQHAIERHRVPAADAVFLFQPIHHDRCLGLRPVATSLRLIQQLLRGLASLGFDGVEVRLVRHVLTS